MHHRRRTLPQLVALVLGMLLLLTPTALADPHECGGNDCLPTTP